MLHAYPFECLCAEIVQNTRRNPIRLCILVLSLLLLGLVTVLGKHDLARLPPLLDAALFAFRLARCRGGLSGVDIHGSCSQARS